MEWILQATKEQAVSAIRQALETTIRENLNLPKREAIFLESGYLATRTLANLGLDDRAYTVPNWTPEQAEPVEDVLNQWIDERNRVNLFRFDWTACGHLLILQTLGGWQVKIFTDEHCPIEGLLYLVNALGIEFAAFLPSSEGETGPGGGALPGKTRTGKSKGGRPRMKCHQDALQRLQDGQTKEANFHQWKQEYEAETGTDPDHTESQARELHRKSVWSIWEKFTGKN